MTSTRFTLDDLGRGLTSRALLSFVRMLPASSRTAAAQGREAEDSALWEGQRLVPQLLAALVDEVRMLGWSFAQAHSKQSLKGQMPKPIPRPGVDDGSKRVGSDPIPISEFDKWWKEG